MKREKGAHIVVVTDKNMIESTIVLACSIFRRIHESVHLHIVCDQLDISDQNRISSILDLERGQHEISLLPVSSGELCVGLNQKYHFTQAAYLRLFFDMLFPDLNRIIYMDTDMLVMKNFDTQELLNTVDNNSIAAVEDKNLRSIYQKAYPSRQFVGFFNTGFLVMNLEKLRENHILQEMACWLKSNMENNLYADQDSFCAFLSSDCFWLDVHLNVTKGHTKDTIILHYAGHIYKPWLKTASLFWSKNSISSLPYILFRQKTPLRKKWHTLSMLLFSQFLISVVYVLIPHNILKNIQYIFRKIGIL